jgi:hypothetical protein
VVANHRAQLHVRKCQIYVSHLTGIPLWLPRHSGFELVHLDS